MLYVYFGNDTNRLRTEAIHKFGEINFSRIEPASFVPGQLLASAKGQSLFGGVEGFLIDTPSDNQEYWDEFIDSLPSLKKSSHIFVLIEGSILAEDKKKIAKFGEEINEFKKNKGEEFNQFAITDALSSRDKRLLWMLLQDSIKNGSATEEVIGLLWWQLKSMRLAALTNTAAEAGMKDYPYKKAKASLAKFPLPQVVEKSRSLTKLYHNARSGKGDLLEQLEVWTLTL